MHTIGIGGDPTARKVFVAATVRFDPEGRMTPLRVEWEDGRVFEVDRLLDARRAASLKVGGQGMRYTCRIQGKDTFLFFDGLENRWFVEGKERNAANP